MVITILKKVFKNFRDLLADIIHSDAFLFIGVPIILIISIAILFLVYSYQSHNSTVINVSVKSIHYTSHEETTTSYVYVNKYYLAPIKNKENTYYVTIKDKNNNCYKGEFDVDDMNDRGRYDVSKGDTVKIRVKGKYYKNKKKHIYEMYDYCK